MFIHSRRLPLCRIRARKRRSDGECTVNNHARPIASTYGILAPVQRDRSKCRFGVYLQLHHNAPASLAEKNDGKIGR
jgi:hypothetical protein